VSGCHSAHRVSSSQCLITQHFACTVDALRPTYTLETLGGCLLGACLHSFSTLVLILTLTKTLTLTLGVLHPVSLHTECLQTSRQSFNVMRAQVRGQARQRPALLGRLVPHAAAERVEGPVVGRAREVRTLTLTLSSLAQQLHTGLRAAVAKKPTDLLRVDSCAQRSDLVGGMPMRARLALACASLVQWQSMVARLPQLLRVGTLTTPFVLSTAVTRRRPSGRSASWTTSQRPAAGT